MSSEIKSKTSRASVLERARELVGAAGSVIDYPCDCGPGGERFIVEWRARPQFRICYNIEELEREK